jgi:hypothetical protein
MTAKAQVWLLPVAETIIITDFIDIIPEAIIQVNPDKNPALTYPPECHLGRFPTWQEGLFAARQHAAETGFRIVEEKLCQAWEIEPPAWLSEVSA